MELRTSRFSKGIFVTISVFFLALAMLAVSNLQTDAKANQANTYADLSDISDISAIRSNIEWMTREAFSVSGFEFSVYGQTLSIEHNDSLRGHLSNDLQALEVFWNNVEDKDVSLDFFDEAGNPTMYIRPANITIIQNPTNTSIVVPDYSNSSIQAYFITMETNCSDLSSSWNNISEINSSDALNFTMNVKCLDTAKTYSTFKQLDRSQYSELQIMDAGYNLSVIRITNPGSIGINTLKSSYLNIIIPMNERVYYEIPASLNITSGQTSISSVLRIPGDIE